MTDIASLHKNIDHALIADRHHWPLLRGSQLSLSEKNGEAGLSVRLQPASCQCEHSSCEPAAQH